MNISIGSQKFDQLIEENSFYIDKSCFIKAWWESISVTTILHRPRQFGKTLNLNMLYCFFSNQYDGRSDLFRNLSIWQEPKYRKLQGSYPVIYMSFDGIVPENIKEFKSRLKYQIWNLFEQHRYLLASNLLSNEEKQRFLLNTMNMDDEMYYISVQELCSFLQRYYGKKVIVLLDSYDIPMMETHDNVMENEMLSIISTFFHYTFIENQSLERGFIMGTHKTCSELLFRPSDNVSVISTFSDEFGPYFGFTMDEVHRLLLEHNYTNQENNLRQWYSGFIFGKFQEIYNPWSLANFFNLKVILPYWEASSSTILMLLRAAPSDVINKLSSLLQGNKISINRDSGVVWSQMLDEGYLMQSPTSENGNFDIRVTNLEARRILADIIDKKLNKSEG